MKGWLATLGRNKGLKLLSLLLALAFWFAVSGEERTETTLHVPLEFVNLPANMVIRGEVPFELEVRIIGPRSAVNRLSQSRLSQTINLGNYKRGPHTVYLGPDSFSFPQGVVVTRIQPNPLILNLSTSISATLPIRAVTAGTPPEGYELKSVKTKPDQATVSGPEEELRGLKFLSTYPLLLDHLTKPTSIPVNLDFKNLHLTLKNPVPILAEIVIQPKPLTRTLAGVPVIPEPTPASLLPSKVMVTVQGSWAGVKELTPAEVQARVDTTNLGPKRRRLQVAVTLPPGIRLVRVQPAWVSAFRAAAR